MFVPIHAIVGLDEKAMDRLRKLAGKKLTSEEELLLVSETSRSQQTNKEACFERLAELVLKAEVAPKKRKPTKPTRGSIERRLQSKQKQSDRKNDRRSNRNPRDD